MMALQNNVSSALSHPSGILFEKCCKTISLPEEKAVFSDAGNYICFFYEMNTQQILMSAPAEETALLWSKS